MGRIVEQDVNLGDISLTQCSHTHTQKDFRPSGLHIVMSTPKYLIRWDNQRHRYAQILFPHKRKPKADIEFMALVNGLIDRL